jgi:hypothetical protein
LFIQLTIACECLATFYRHFECMLTGNTDIEMLPSPTDVQCNIINDTLCGIIRRDTFTLIVTVWASLQLIWVTMLCAVQLVQISRNQTTYENMRGHSINHAHPNSQAIASALAAGTTSLDAAGLTSAGQGPNPAVTQGPPPRRSQGCFEQWKKLIGLDTFFATAQGRSSRRKNPFSRGFVANCRDFWCDPAPIFGKREPGSAMLDGQTVNYYRMYETPLTMHSGRRGGLGATYMSLAGDDPERGV